MIEEDVIKFCITHKISVSQYYFMWMVLNKDEWSKSSSESLVNQYLTHCGVFKNDEIESLVLRGLVINMNATGKAEPNFYIIDDEVAKQMFVDEDMAEELWNAYPPEFPLSTGSTFLARAGGDKSDLLKDYRKRIKNSPRKHRFVMTQLTTYKEMVMSGRTNGRKISDWIREEIWDTVAAISEHQANKGGSDYVRDI